MSVIKVKTPAKINLTLEMVGLLENGYHSIKSIMSTINLYDFLTFEITNVNTKLNDIYLSGNNPQIPYNSENLVYKVIELFFEKTKISGKKIKVNIEKHIPVEAGLAGGSSNAAGTLLALNKFFNEPLENKELNEICAKLGSDLNFCLVGGCCICENRGEKITLLKPLNLGITLIKPKNFGISTKEAYKKFDDMKDKPVSANSDKLKNIINKGKFDKKLLINHLEKAVINDYPILKKIKKQTEAIMSGSGPTMFTLTNTIDKTYNEDILVIDNLKTIDKGVEIVQMIF